MATIESPEVAGLRTCSEFDDVHATWPRGDRLEAIRDAAGVFRARFKAAGEVQGARSIDLVSAAYPVRYAFGGAVRGVINPYLNILNRLVVVRFEDFSGESKVLCWEPTVPEGSAQAPYYAQLIERYGEFFADRIGSREYNTVESALAECGLGPADVDYVAFDHLHVQDMRLLMGTTRPVGGEREPRAPFFPKAKFVCQRREVDTFRSPHPMQWPWYVPGGMEHVIEDDLVLIDGDVELGVGVALVWTPGHTDGNQSLVINTPDGVWVSSENGVAADNWHPNLSKIPGVRKEAESMGREVIMNSNTLEDSLDQYDSMIKEKTIADPNREDPRWKNVLPSSELPPWRRQWPVVPSFVYGGFEYGQVASAP